MNQTDFTDNLFRRWDVVYDVAYSGQTAFVESVRQSYVRHGRLTEKQVDALEKLVTQCEKFHHKWGSV